ncbi:TRAP transporter large permease [Acuticoccus mangrovi]|uniref:TRAP transporter large permease protein n=1 Tax=Acuticoccus mangrovi TaxID=2796142 RepID=A0A934IHD5_9HYPH|nr:TRAP transporter large permease [Acuticoccus mangrovi]MBJ3775021.1 TRAP transporter large permease [Acuticoccus mangrovi]
MSDPLVGLLGFVVALALILVGMPVAVALGLVGAVGFAILNGVSGAAFVLASAPFEAMFPYTLSVIPLFLLMGVFAARCGLSRDLYSAADALVGRLRGGLALATIVASAAFGAICGSSLATVATIGRVAVPEMRAAGYDDRLSAASIAAGGTLGVLIPPSILLVIYGILTEQSIGALFSAAIIPGLLATLLYGLSVAIQVRLMPELAGPPRALGRRERRADVLAAWPAALIFAVAIGGIQFGLFSPTEAAAVGAAGALLVALARRALTRPILGAAVMEVVSTTGMVFFIIVGATLFNFFVETAGLPQYLVGAIAESGFSAGTVLLLVIVFYLVLGCFMDSMAMIFLTVPFIFPVVTAMGYDPIWFGILVVTVAEIGLITPPIGMNLFVLQGVAPDLASRTVMRGVVPFLIADAVRLALLVAVPSLALWLPSTMR